MRILMFGRGVIATSYGLALQDVGHDVEFLVRPGRAAEYGGEVTTDIVDARSSVLGKRVRRVGPTRLREALEPGESFDLVVLSVGHHRLAEAAAQLAPHLGNATVLVFGNIWEEPLDAIAPLPADQVVFGFPQTGGGFDGEGTLHGAMFRTVIIEAVEGHSAPRNAAVCEAFRQAGFSISRQQDMRGWLLLHFATDVGMHAEAIHWGGIASLAGNRRGFRDALTIAREMLPVLHARGVDLEAHRRSAFVVRRPGLVAGPMAWASAHLPIAQESLASHTNPFAPEAVAVLRDAVRAVRAVGAVTPRLDAAIESLDAAVSNPGA